MNINEQLKELYKEWKSTGVCDIDGLVISDSLWINESTFYPKAKIAWKQNSEGISVKVLGIEWNVSKSGSLKPVVLLNPTELEGSTISRVTGIHAQWIKENGVDKDSTILLIKSGTVIPKIVGVVTSVDVNLPTICPCCGIQLQWKSVDLVCNNIHCTDKLVQELSSFLTKCEIDNVSSKSLINWGIFTFQDLLSFDPDNFSKSQDKFAQELQSKVFTKTKEELFVNLSFEGGGSTNINKILDYFGQGDVVLATQNLYIGKQAMFEMKGFPEGIGMKIIDKIETDWKRNLNILGQFVKDRRYNPKAKVVKVSTGNLSGLSFLLTGAFTEKKSILEKMITDNGGTLASSVSKTLSVLVSAPDSWGSSSKYVKAEKLGLKIITEDELKDMING